MYDIANPILAPFILYVYVLCQISSTYLAPFSSIATRLAYLNISTNSYNFMPRNQNFTLKIELISAKNLNKILENSTLVKIDTWALYTNIPHDEGLKEVETLKFKDKPIRIIITFLK